MEQSPSTATRSKGLVTIAKQAKVWTGSAWADLASATTDLTPYSTTAQMNTAIAASAGLTLVNTTTFTASSTVSINNCFNSTYDNYKIILSITSASGSVDMFIRMRASGTDNSSSQYGYYNSNYPMGSAPSNSSSASSSFMYAGTTDTTGLSSGIELYSPFIASKTMTTISAVNPAGYGYLLYNRMTVTNSYDGITFYPSSGNVTGNIRIYGYKNS